MIRASGMSSLAALFLYASLLFAASFPSAQAKRPSSVPFAFLEDGDYHVLAEDSVKWRIVETEVDGRSFYFYNTITGDTQWEDPRIPSDHGQKSVEMREGKVVQVKTKYEFDKTGKVVKKVESLDQGFSKYAVTIIPLLLFLGGMISRIYYLHVYHPELLFPTKERKFRRAKQSKFKAQKARGKMSQDGKGGRSANS